jgi:hypothetical protein
MVTLRVSGASFDVNAFLREFQIAPVLIFLRGEPKYPETQPNGPVLDRSGMNVDVSDAEFGDLDQQSHDTVRFLADNLAMLARMSNYPGIEDIELDFAVCGGDGFVESYRFSPELLELVGRLGFTLCISRYVQADDNAPHI